MSSIQEIFTNIDFDSGTYKLKGLALKIKDLTVTEMEKLQDKEAENNELPNDLPASEILKKAREWQEFILTTAFGKEVDIVKIKKTLTAMEYKRMIEEVFVFLGHYGGPGGANEFINSLKTKNNSNQKITGS